MNKTSIESVLDITVKIRLNDRIKEEQEPNLTHFNRRVFYPSKCSLIHTNFAMLDLAPCVVQSTTFIQRYIRMKSSPSKLNGRITVFSENSIQRKIREKWCNRWEEVSRMLIM